MNINKLKSNIEKKIRDWNERSCFTIKGVKNLSRSDLDMIIMYADIYAKQGNFDGYMQPRGGVRDVLAAYGIG